MKHWHIDELGWDRFDPSKVDPEIVPLIKAAAMVERNAADYVTYLTRVFADDPDFCAASARPKMLPIIRPRMLMRSVPSSRD